MAKYPRKTSLVIDINLGHKNQHFYDEVMKALMKHLNDRIPKALPKIKDNFQRGVKKILRETDTYKSLIDGELQAHFGLPRGVAFAKLQVILNNIAQDTLIRYRPIKLNGRKFTKGGIELYILEKDLNAILGPGAGDEQYVLSDNAAKRGRTAGKRDKQPWNSRLHWLRWLLVEGNKIIVHGSEIALGSFRGSRSGKAIMIKKRGGTWRVPPEYSGTLKNNWLTRTLHAANADIHKLVFNSMKYHIGQVL